MRLLHSSHLVNGRRNRRLSSNLSCVASHLLGHERNTYSCSRIMVGWFWFWTAGMSLTQHHESVPVAKLDRCSANSPVSASLSAHGGRRLTYRFLGRQWRSAP